MRLRLATRRSALARAQSHWVAQQIEANHPGIKIDMHLVTTRGDQVQHMPLADIGGKGLFIREVERALIQGDADIAVHSLKDIPNDEALAEGLTIGCIPPREDAQDVIIAPESSSLDALPPQARVGTCSPRRQYQLQAHRPDLQMLPLRGNIDTRLRKLRDGQYDAIVLAAAGLNRLQVDTTGLCLTALAPHQCVPAAGQGALAIELHQTRADLLDLLAPLHHHPTAEAVRVERQLVNALQGNCHSPIGVHAWWQQQELHMFVYAARPDGSNHTQIQHHIDMRQPNWANISAELRSLSDSIRHQLA